MVKDLLHEYYLYDPLIPKIKMFLVTNTNVLKYIKFNCLTRSSMVMPLADRHDLSNKHIKLV